MALTYAIIGSGALGGLYGARLHTAGQEVHFLFHRDFEHVRAHGLKVESHWGDLHPRDLNTYGDVADMPPCDVVCVALKTTENHLFSRLLPPVSKPGGTILLLQNGLGAEEEVAALLPDRKVAGGLCFLCSNKVGPGHIRHLDYGHITLGTHSPGMAEQIAAIASDFRAAGVPCEILPDLAEARWRKLVWNIPYNGLCTILDTTTDRVMAEPSTRALARAVMEEVLAGAAACGHALGPDCIETMLDYTEKMKPYAPSMLLDRRGGRPLEVEYLYRHPLEAAAARGVALPRIAVLEAQLTFLSPRPLSARPQMDARPTGC